MGHQEGFGFGHRNQPDVWVVWIPSVERIALAFAFAIQINHEGPKEDPEHIKNDLGNVDVLSDLADWLHGGLRGKGEKGLRGIEKG
jgi:hypothetical protein